MHTNKRLSVRPKTGAVTIREQGSVNVTAVAPPQASRLAEARAESDHMKARLRIVGEAVLGIRRVLEREAERLPPDVLEAIVASCNTALVEGLGLDGIEVAYDEQTATAPDAVAPAEAPTPTTPELPTP